MPSQGDADACLPRVGDALRWAIRLLVAHGIETPRLEAELLLSHVLGEDRARLYALWETSLSPEQVERFTQWVRRRARREPLAYLVGQRAFYDLTLEVTPEVLIPRPETEHLVEAALAWAKGQDRPLRIIDVGTGSGALAVAVARHLPTARVWAVDLSPQALQVAQRNVLRYGLADRIALIQGDLLTAFKGPFDLILANLPYVSTEELPTLAPEIALYEPRLALDGGRQGVEVILRLLASLPWALAVPGLALFEIDPRQAAPLKAEAADLLPEAEIRLLQDYAGRERVLYIEREEGTCNGEKKS